MRDEPEQDPERGPEQDPWTERLSEYLDGELASAERRQLWRHLADCEHCPATLEELRGVRDAAGRLADAAPPRDLWPGIAAELQGNVRPGASTRRPGTVRAPRFLLGLAAGFLIAWSLALYFRDASGAPERDVGLSRFLLLLHEDPVDLAQLTPEKLGSLVAEYRDWSLGVAQDGRLLAGEKLADERGFWLAGTGAAQAAGDEGELIGGYFLIQAEDYAAANAIASSCPHLTYGGSIEVRRLEDL